MSDTQQAILKLYASALEASNQAYSPYSGAKVGASVLDSNGNIYTGCNVENASYGLTQCAERNALAAGVNAGMKADTAVTILIYATGFDVLAPCGACRQVIYELMAKGATVISCSSETEYRSWTIEELLPDPFILE
jgi:cytidine deaminase